MKVVYLRALYVGGAVLTTTDGAPGFRDCVAEAPRPTTAVKASLPRD